jgi:hypothetical protein
MNTESEPFDMEELDELLAQAGRELDAAQTEPPGAEEDAPAGVAGDDDALAGLDELENLLAAVASGREPRVKAAPTEPAAACAEPESHPAPDGAELTLSSESAAVPELESETPELEQAGPLLESEPAVTVSAGGAALDEPWPEKAEDDPQIPEAAALLDSPLAANDAPEPVAPAPSRVRKWASLVSPIARIVAARAADVAALLLTLLDRPFSSISPWKKSIIGCVATATAITAAATLLYGRLRS